MTSKVRMGLCTAAVGASSGFALVIWGTQEELPGDQVNLGLAAAILGAMIAVGLYALGRSLADPARRKPTLLAVGGVAVMAGLTFGLGFAVYRLEPSPPQDARLAGPKDSFELHWEQDQALAPVRDIYSHRVYGRPYAELDEGHRFVVEYMRAYDQSPASK